MKNKYITYEELIKRNQFIDNLKRNRVILSFKKNKFKLCLGVGCVVVGFITLPIPTGSVFLIGLGCMLLEFNKVDLHLFRDKVKRKIRGLFK